MLRRLNAREYRNTLRDLLHLNMTMFDPTAGFPRDQTTDHADNVGETLVTSGHLLQRYLAAARQVTEKVFAPARKPPVQTWAFRGDFRQGLGIDGVHKRTNGLKHMTLYEVVGSDKIESAYGAILAFQDGVPFRRDLTRSGSRPRRSIACTLTTPNSSGRIATSRSGSGSCRGTRRSGRCTSRSRSSRSWPRWS